METQIVKDVLNQVLSLVVIFRPVDEIRDVGREEGLRAEDHDLVELTNALIEEVNSFFHVRDFLCQLSRHQDKILTSTLRVSSAKLIGNLGFDSHHSAFYKT